jgi:hypothetical protein
MSQIDIPHTHDSPTAATDVSPTPTAGECFLNITPDPTIIHMIKYLHKDNKDTVWSNLYSLIRSYKLTQVERDTPAAATSSAELNISQHPVLINSCHGGLPVVRSINSLKPPDFLYEYSHFIARSKIRRIIKAPPTCCTYSFPEVRQQYFDDINKIITSLNLPRDTPRDNDVVTQDIKDALGHLSFDISVDQRTQIERLQSGSEHISVNSDRAFEYVETESGNLVIRKLFTTDTVTPRGILFCNDVTITINNSWFSVIRPNDTIINNDRRGYEIGIYNSESSSIYYHTGTNLLSCPYFMCFASRCLGTGIIKDNNSLSLGTENKRLIPMVARLTAEVLYWYFFNQPFLFIDMSCESLCYEDVDGNQIDPEEARNHLRSDGYKPQLIALQNIQKKGYRIRGGNCKKGYNPKKRYKTKKYKKRCNSKTKRYKTKKYRK